MGLWIEGGFSCGGKRRKDGEAPFASSLSSREKSFLKGENFEKSFKSREPYLGSPFLSGGVCRDSSRRFPVGQSVFNPHFCKSASYFPFFFSFSRPSLNPSTSSGVEWCKVMRRNPASSRG